MANYWGEKEEMNLADPIGIQHLLLKLVDNVILNFNIEFDSDASRYRTTFATEKGDVFKVTVERLSKRELGVPTYSFKPVEG
jgi:hypothetical protein